MQVKVDTFIQSSRARVWSVFVQTESWGIWQQEMHRAIWIQGEPWQDGSVIEIGHRLGTKLARVRLVAENEMAVLEIRTWYASVVNVFEIADSVGGCRVSIKETWHVPLKWLVPILRSIRVPKPAEDIRHAENSCGRSQGDCLRPMPANDWPRLGSDALAVWERIAPSWAAHMGDQGNDFHNLLVRPTAIKLLQPISGRKILELGCGAGLFTGDLVRAGAEVVATDGAKSFVDIACRRNPQCETVRLDVTNEQDWSNLRHNHHKFDAVVCNMMFMDVATVDLMCREVAALLRPGGSWVISQQHPCFVTGEVSLIAERASTGVHTGVKVSKYLNVKPYKDLGIPTQPEKHYCFHRPLQSIVASITGVGLVIDALVEPSFPETAEFGKPLTLSSVADIPPVLFLRALKA